MASGEARVEYEVLAAPDGRIYYYNKRTGESSFSKPDVLKGSDEDFDVDPWIECRSKRGRVFYHNSITRESRWKRPPERKKERTMIGGVGMDMRITDHETSKYLLGRLMEQYGITSTKDAFYRLSTEPIFRAIEMGTRKDLMKKYFEEQEKSAREEDEQKQRYYINEVCKVDAGVSDFFGFNSIFSKHPYYSKIKDKFGCYEVYVGRHMGGTTPGRLEEVFRSLGIGLSSSVVDVLKMKEMEPFDRKAILFSFIRYFRRLEKELLSAIEERKAAAAQNAQHHKNEFRTLLRKLYSEGLIYYRMKFKNAFHLFKDSESFLNLLGTTESPKEVYFDFINDLENRLGRYERERTGKISPTDRRAVDRYFEAIAEEKEEGEI
ncbi:hypothetical protein [Encephalitozoon cuniculi GB-M1]|uniref:WW domain-containing protein n=1 Tax=Encephalitozoon cuniculi (strain GB-M1) TaxID=284813 RepID=Q8STT7_ENCCU|nr:uncharacterized protein ECU09_0700 [Encephalitozoon cuniculi GB-M1]CAD27043.2 hypothetical protein [Encephalitozoon cuniculi GB-M1]